MELIEEGLKKRSIEEQNNNDAERQNKRKTKFLYNIDNNMSFSREKVNKVLVLMN